MLEPTLPDEKSIRALLAELYSQASMRANTKTELHSLLQESISRSSHKFALKAIKEYVLPHFRGERDGRIDVVWAVGSIPVVAFEIDSRYRPKSLRKLLAISANLRFWVYFDPEPFEALTKRIDPTNMIRVVHLPTSFGRQNIQTEPVTANGKTNSAELSVSSSQHNAVKSFAVIRKNYPKAYEKWSAEEDNLLREQFIEGTTVSDLARVFQRKVGAIQSRLKRLGLLR